MNKFHNVLIAAAAAAAAASPPVHAQSHSHGHDAPAVKAVAADKAGETSEGEVRKVDKAGKKITLKHGPMKNLDMPAMTMAFQVTDLAFLDKVQVGDKVRFVAANPGGKLTITKIEVAK